jgi:hypothetical protein
LEDARAQVNCLLNLFFLALVIALAASARFLTSLHWTGGGADAFGFLNALKYGSSKSAGIAFAALVCAWVVYELSIERIYAWGSLVKAAFDCYLPELAETLGYKLPLDGARQRAFWVAVSRRAIYNRPLNPRSGPEPTKLCH